MTARCRDISLGGMFIETDAPLPYGSALRVHVRLPGLKGESTLRAVVRWAAANGMGIQFGTMGARETHALTLLLAPSR
jgi:type IV pilus assembly protein PilZ